MKAQTKNGVAVLIGDAFILSVAIGGHAGELRFQHVMNIGTRGNEPGRFAYVKDFTFSKDGRLLVTDAAKVDGSGKVSVSDLRNNRIQLFDQDGKFIKLWGKTGAGPGEFMAPAGIGLDQHDNIHITEIGNHRVQVFDKNGNFLIMWGKKGAENGEFDNKHCSG
jgi:DNA-binding beta-propeller fold protein YncE